MSIYHIATNIYVPVLVFVFSCTHTLQYFAVFFFLFMKSIGGCDFFFTFIIGVYSTAERKRSCSQQDGPVNGFHNNFGHSIGGVGYRGEEGVLIANILKPFVSKCVDNARELYGSDNIVCRIVHS